MAKRFHIDTLDRRILGILAKDVRIPFTEIARICNVTASAIHQRVQKLHENNVLDPKNIAPDNDIPHDGMPQLPPDNDINKNQY